MASKLQQPTNSISTPADPPLDFEVVTPSDTDDLAYTARAISFAVDGDIVVTTLAGNDRTIPSGSLATLMQHSMQITRIKATGTTATGIIAWY